MKDIAGFEVYSHVLIFAYICTLAEKILERMYENKNRHVLGGGHWGLRKCRIFGAVFRKLRSEDFVVAA